MPIYYNTIITYKEDERLDIGKRVVLIGTAYKDGVDLSSYDGKIIQVRGMLQYTEMFGITGTLYNAYMSYIESGVSSVYIMRVPDLYNDISEIRTMLSKTDETNYDAVPNDDVRSIHIKSVIEALADSLDFDICVLTHITYDMDYKYVSDVIETISQHSSNSLFLIGTSKISSDTKKAWEDRMTYANLKLDVLLNNIASNGGFITAKKNMCIIANNIDDNIDPAPYIAGLISYNKFIHPTRIWTSLSSVTDLSDSIITNISYFKQTVTKGIRLVNFKCLEQNKYALSAFNLYMLNVILSVIKQELVKYIGDPNIVFSSGSVNSIYIYESAETILEEFKSLDVISDYEFESSDTIKTELDIYLSITFSHNIETVKINTTVGVGA